MAVINLEQYIPPIPQLQKMTQQTPSINNDLLEDTRKFWNASPCDGQEDFETRKAFRYLKEPFIPEILQLISSRHKDIVEIGCGMGTDGLTLCSLLSPPAKYRGIDYSDESLAFARGAAEKMSGLKITPIFMKGNAEALDIESDSVECIYSMGVLHHTPNTEQSIREIYRVLKPGGKAYIFLYNIWSPKVFIAHFLRIIQSIVDKIFGTKRVFYNLFYGRHLEPVFGTALLEGFGVPVLRSYTRYGMKKRFREFNIISIEGCGLNLPPNRLQAHQKGHKATGMLWFASVEKPADQS